MKEQVRRTSQAQSVTPLRFVARHASGLVTPLRFVARHASGLVTPLRFVARHASGLAVLLIFATLLFFMAGVPNEVAAGTDGYQISGYVKPGFSFDITSSPVLKSGFVAEISGTEYRAQTNENGYFAITGVPGMTSGCTVVIKKLNYLYRSIPITSLSSNIAVGTADVPVDVWAGDIEVQGSRDKAINMADIMEIAGSFNSVSGDLRYKEPLDLNKDGAVNMADILITAISFNKVEADYPPANITILPTQSPTPTVTTPPTSAPGIGYMGRFDFSDSKGPKYAWTGSSIIANFYGTEVSATIKSTGENWFNIIIDGKVQTPIMVNSQVTVSLAKGLTEGNHQVILWKRTEASQGEVQFLGFNFGQGKLLSPPAPAARKIEFIGDSITCAYGNEGTDRSQPFTPKNENSYLSYGAITARSLNADAHFIAWSGIGVARNYGGAAGPTMPERYPMTLPQSNVLWNFSNYTPQVVVINLGTNDFSTTPYPSKTAFTTGYKNLIAKARTHYPNARVFCTIGPMLWGDGLTTCRDYVKSVVDELKAQGDTKLHLLEYPQQQESNGYGEDWHPSLVTHRLMADKLTAEIKLAMGW